MLANHSCNTLDRRQSLSAILAGFAASRARPLRFAAVGALAGLIQLSLLSLLTGAAWNGMAANAVAFLISAQVNFGLGNAFTWGDRRSRLTFKAVLTRWVRFHTSIAGTALLNMATFAITRTFLPDVPASAVGISVASLANYVLGDRFVFRGASANAVVHAMAPAVSQEVAAPVASAMAAADGSVDSRKPELPKPARETGVPMWSRLALLAVTGMAGFLYSWGLAANGYANEYYAAAALSMSKSWSNFFFGSLDPGGFITVDKPPIAFWPQALLVHFFGLNSWSILLPQAVEGVLTVVIVYHLVRRVFGHVAAIIAALALALTPITVAVNRDNLPDSLLVLLMVAAAWALLNALQSARWRPLLISALLLGIAFNVKMLQAFIVVPTFALVYLIAAPTTFRRRIAQLAVTGLALAIVSLS